MKPVILALTLCASPAEAGRALYGWLPPTETVSEDAIAVEGSIYERDDRGPMHERASVLSLAPVIGLSDRFELALPIELAYITATDIAPMGGFSRFGIEARYRLAARDAAWTPSCAPSWSSVSPTRSVRSTSRPRPGSLARSILPTVITRRGSALAPASKFVTHYAPGSSCYSELALDAASTSWAVIGPNVVWTRRRFWLGAALDIGIYGIAAAPRINWGMAW